MQNSTLKDVAKLAGVHLSTASRALDPRMKHLISEDIIEVVGKAARKLNYRRNRVAAGLRTRKTKSLGIVIPDITNPFFPPIIRGIEDRTAQEDYVALIGHTDGDSTREGRVIEAFCSRGIDALIVASADIVDKHVIQALSSGIPIVTINRQVKHSKVSSVGSDDDAGISEVLRHLASLGHKRISFISGPTTSWPGIKRYDAFVKWSRKLHLLGGEELVQFATDFRESEGERCAAHLLDTAPNLTAIVCANDLLAIGAISRLRESGLSCPGDVSVTGFNDMRFADRLNPALTTVNVPKYDLGWKAADVALNAIQTAVAKRVTTNIVLPISLQARDSSGPAKGA
jgi:LacI family transcriptional regulator